MKRKPVTSSNIKTVGYDNKNQVLEVEFNSGKIYHYYTVPESVYNEMMAAESIGKFHVSRIKGVYNYQEGSFQA